MQFKVGDRVEVLKPAQGTGFSQKNNIGRGTVEAINDDVSEVCVRVDTNDLAWWYDIESVRPLTPATTLEKPYPYEYPKPTPTPSITVGTQVRLTGVVGDKDGDKRIRVDFGEDAEDEWAWIPCKAKCLEVIRQPFKRGEVLYSKIAATNETPFVVLNDESLGFIDVTNCETGFYIPNDNAEAYERRP